MKELTQFEKYALKRSRKSRKEATKNSIPPSSVADLDTCSGMSKKSGSRSGDPDPGIRIRNEKPRSYFQELKNQFFWVKIRKFFDADPGWRKFGSGIRDGKHSDPGSGINIPDSQHCLQVKTCNFNYYSITFSQLYSTWIQIPFTKHRPVIYSNKDPKKNVRF